MKRKDQEKVDARIKDRVKPIRDDVEDLKVAVGYKPSASSYGGMTKSKFTVAEQLAAICEHLGITIVWTPPQKVKVEKIKSSRAKKE